MINIIIYLDYDGTIIRCVSCPEGMEQLQCHDGEAYIEHERVDDAKYKIDLATLQVVPV